MLELFPADQTTRDTSAETLSAGEILARRQAALRRLTSPRDVRPTKEGLYFYRFVLAMIPVLAAFPIYSLLWTQRTGALNGFPSIFWTDLATFAWIFILAVYQFQRRTGERDLLSRGTLVEAHIVRQYFGVETSSEAYIDYEFSDSRGHIWKRRTLDKFGGYSEGMTVLVFYDVDHPERQIADCSTEYYEIILPGES